MAVTPAWLSSPCFSRGDSRRSQAPRTVAAFSLLLLALRRTLVPLESRPSPGVSCPQRAWVGSCTRPGPRDVLSPAGRQAAWPTLRGLLSRSRGGGFRRPPGDGGLQMADRPRAASPASNLGLLRVAVRASSVTFSLCRQKVCLGETASVTVSPCHRVLR